MQKPKLIILDRDGIINYDSPLYIKSPEEWHPIPGSLEAIAKLKQSGYAVAVATNQSGVARGLYSEETLGQIHDKMIYLLAELDTQVDRIFYCPHHPDERCHCRKPNPGMLLSALESFDLDPQDALMVGDREADKGAAFKARVPFIRVHQTLDTVHRRQYSSLHELVEQLLLTLT